MSIGITADDLDWARAHNPNGVLRLAKFVEAADDSSEAIEEALERHRLVQPLASPTKIRATRAK